MYRVALITKNGEIKSKNSNIREKIDDFILSIDEKEGVKHYRIMDKETKKIIETEKGRR